MEGAERERTMAADGRRVGRLHGKRHAELLTNGEARQALFGRLLRPSEPDAGMPGATATSKDCTTPSASLRAKRISLVSPGTTLSSRSKEAPEGAYRDDLP